jgi:hypothetical protein
MSTVTFVVDCPYCKAKVAAIEEGKGERFYSDEDSNQPYGERIHVGHCPRCRTLLVGESQQVDFEGYDAYEDRWSDVVRVYPKPPKAFSSGRVPRVVSESLAEADRALQANASIAACVMLGRALEALCRDILHEPEGHKKKLTLANGIKRLRELNHIDDRLLDWSQQLHAFRNLAAHPDEISISRQDADDLQIFAYAIVEYIYDLSDRYEDFKQRLAKLKDRKPPES